MTSPQVRSWFGHEVPTVAAHPAVQALAAKWLQIRSERDPTLADFWHDPDDALANSSILFLKGDSDFTYLHHGRTLRDRIGFSMQGLRLSELRTRIRSALIEIYDRSVSEFALAYFQSFADFQQDVVLWGRLCLPLRLSEEDRRVALLLYCHPIEDKVSIARAVFEQSNLGIVIAAPIKDEAGRIVDGWIVAQNDQACAVTGVYEHGSADLLLRHTALFGRDDLWDYLTEDLSQRAKVATVTDAGRGLTLTVTLELISEYLVARTTHVEEPRAFAIG